MRNIDDLFEALAKSKFRSRFKLFDKEHAYLADKGLAEVIRHAQEFISQRLADASPRNDGKQTPTRGHPAFIAQHATGTCCRTCLENWHGIKRGHVLTTAEKNHIMEAIERWLLQQ